MEKPALASDTIANQLERINASAPNSLRLLIEQCEVPALLLEFKRGDHIKDPTSATIKDVTVLCNTIADSKEFKPAVENLLSEKLQSKPKSNLKLCLGSETRFHEIGKDSWSCIKLGAYNFWTLNSLSLSNEREPTSPKVSTKEEVLYNRLDRFQAPLQAFSDLTDQTLGDAKAAVDNLSNIKASTTGLDVDILDKAAKQIYEVELNLRTISSGLALLKDIANISDISPPPPPESTHQPEPRSDRALLDSFRGPNHKLEPTKPGYVLSEDAMSFIPTLRLLVVEDNIVNQKLICKIAERHGLAPENITKAYNGAEGLEVLERLDQAGQFPEIMLVDCSMPVMGGFEFLDKYHKRWPGRRVRIIGLSAHIMLGDVDKFKEHGAQFVIRKPFRISDIKGHIEKLARMKFSRSIEFKGKL